MITTIVAILITTSGILGYSKYTETQENKAQHLRQKDVDTNGKRFYFTKAMP